MRFASCLCIARANIETVVNLIWKMGARDTTILCHLHWLICSKSIRIFIYLCWNKRYHLNFCSLFDKEHSCSVPLSKKQIVGERTTLCHIGSWWNLGIPWRSRTYLTGKALPGCLQIASQCDRAGTNRPECLADAWEIPISSNIHLASSVSRFRFFLSQIFSRPYSNCEYLVVLK